MAILLYFFIIIVIFIVVVFFIIFKLIKKKSQRIRLISLIIAVLISLFYFNKYKNDNYKFNSNDWKEDKHLRHKMFRDIKLNNLLIGKNLEEINDLLGLDYEDCPYGYIEVKNNNYCIIYKLYDTSDWGFDQSVLLISFKNNKVVYVSKEYT